MRRIIIFGLISLAFLILLSLYQLFTLSDNKLHLIFCNVGQGDGILIRTAKGDDIIVDGGSGENTMTDCLSRHLPFWDRTIEAMYLTHPDSDHLTGLIQVVKTYNINYFGTSQAPQSTQVVKELMDSLKEKNIPVHYVFRGDVVKSSDGFSLTTFWPTHEFIFQNDKETNDYSLVQEIKYGTFHALLTGDIPSTYLNSIMPTLGYLDVFKPPHHGSKTGIDEFTFQHLVPKFAVLSFGLNNRYHHPAPSTIKILNEYHIPYKNTLSGDVEIVTDGKSWRVE
jgi:competence protein ComEC